MKDKDLNATVGKESLRTVTACVDGRYIWTSDEALGGLCTIDRITFEVKSVLNTFQMNRYGKFHPKTIFEWKENIVIVPYELDRKWIVYNRVTGKIQYKNVVNSKWKTTGMHVVGENAYLAPNSVQDPIIILDLNSLTCVHIIEDWGKKLPANKDQFVVWESVAMNTGISFSLYGTKYWIKVNHNNTKSYTLDIPYRIRNVDIWEDKMWILPTEGNFLCVADVDGRVLEIIHLSINNSPISTADFVKIVATERYIFLLPFSDKGIFVYDKSEKRIIIITSNVIKSMFPLQGFTVPYWEYFIEDGNICFMPWENRFLTINLDNLECSQRDIFLPEMISGIKLGKWLRWNQFYNEMFINQETNEDEMLGLYLEFVKKSYNVYEQKDKNCGKAILDIMSR